MYENIRNMSLFDFTNDSKVLERYDIDISEKEWYISNAVLSARMGDIYDYAVDTENKDLILALEKEFGERLSDFFDE